MTTSQVLWAEFVAAERDLRAVEVDLLASDFVSALKRALHGSGVDRGTAVAFIERHVPTEFAEAEPELVGALAIEGGIEQRAAAELLLATPSVRDVVLARLVDEVTADPAGDYLKVAGLMALLTRAGQSQMMARIVAYARASRDPDIVELADDPPAVEVPPHVEPAGVETPTTKTGASGEWAWERFAGAWQRFITAFHAVRSQTSVDEMASGVRQEPTAPAALTFVASLLSMPGAADIELASRILISVEPERRGDAMRALAAAMPVGASRRGEAHTALLEIARAQSGDALARELAAPGDSSNPDDGG